MSVASPASKERPEGHDARGTTVSPPTPIGSGGQTTVRYPRRSRKEERSLYLAWFLFGLFVLTPALLLCEDAFIFLLLLGFGALYAIAAPIAIKIWALGGCEAISEMADIEMSKKSNYGSACGHASSYNPSHYGGGSKSSWPSHSSEPVKDARSDLFAGAVLSTWDRGSSFNVADRTGIHMGKVEKDGYVRDRIGSVLGRVEDNGYVRDRDLRYMGRLEDTGTFRDRWGDQQGRIEANGTIRDRYGEYVGRIEKDGTVRNRSGEYMGRIRRQ